MILINILIGLIGLGIVIIVHETGHFIAAKSAGITVEAFSVGWGKKLIGIKRGETEYRLSLIPLGGYCKMRGEDQLLKAWQNEADSIPKEKGSFFSVSPWKRILVVLAGPIFNLLFAVLVFTLLWYIGFTIQTFDNKIIPASKYQFEDHPTEYPADKAGLQAGDRIVAINDKPVEHYQEIQEIVAQSAEETLRMTVERDGRQLHITITPQMDKNTGVGKIGVYAWIEPVIGTVQSGSAADRAGLRQGDRLLSVDDQEIGNSMDLLQALSDGPEKISLEYRRNGEVRETSFVLPYDEQGNPQLGFSFAPLEYETPDMGLFEAIGNGITETGNMLSLVVKSIGLLFQGINVREAVSGPIRITYYVGEVASQGFKLGVWNGITSLFRFLSVISIALFFMNLLPIPALDGGQFILYFLEGITGKELRPRLVYRYQIIGVSLIFMLVIFTTFNDIFYLIQR